MSNLVIYNARLVDENTDAYGAVLLANGKILSICKTDYCTESSAVKIADGIFSDVSSVDPALCLRRLTLRPLAFRRRARRLPWCGAQ